MGAGGLSPPSLLTLTTGVSMSRRQPYSLCILCVYFMGINIHIANPFSDQTCLHYHIECGLRKLLSIIKNGVGVGLCMVNRFYT